MSANSVNINNNNTVEIFSVCENTYVRNAMIANSQIINTNIGVSIVRMLLSSDANINLNIAIVDFTNNKGEFLSKLFVSHDITIDTVNINSNDIQHGIMNVLDH